jgi:hypothetical protein
MVSFARLEYVLLNTGKHLPFDLHHQFEALVTGTGLAVTVGVITLWAGGHFSGGSEVVDAFLLGFGLPFLGLAIFDVAGYFKNFLVLTIHASRKSELDEAASQLSKALAIIGVAAFIALLAKLGRYFDKGSKGPAEDSTSGDSELGREADQKPEVRKDRQVEPSKSAGAKESKGNGPESPSEPKLTDEASLNPGQAANLKRFEDSLPKGAGPTRIYDLPKGGKMFQADVPPKIFLVLSLLMKNKLTL